MIGKIIGTGSYIPDTVWDNHKIAELVETSDEWIRERTGIVRRHIAKQEDTVSMSVKAAERALEDAINQGKLQSAEEIDAIFVCSVSPDLLLPAVACEVQRAIGATNAFAYDMNAACTGFVFAYNTAVSYMNMGLIRYALIVGCEQLSEIVDWSDRGSCILFGDGAGAAVISASEGECQMVMHSDGKGGEALWCTRNGKLRMDGRRVFQFAVRAVPECVEELLEKMKLKKEEIDFFLFHQANARILESVAKRLGIEHEKMPVNIAEYGNTSSASIPILLDEWNRKGYLCEGQRLILAGFGAGLSWGAAYAEI